MYEFPYGGKSLKECVGMLKEAYGKNELSLETMMYGVESLRDSPKDMKAYFNALTEITEDAVAKDVADKFKDTIAVNKVKAGVSIKEVAKELAYDHLRRLINHYNTEEVHKKWNATLPDLKTSGGFSEFF